MAANTQLAQIGQQTAAERLWLAAGWLADSGIVSSESGAVYAWFDPALGTYAFEYTEIAGYAASTFLLLYALSGQTSFLERAHAVGSWILAVAWDPQFGAARCRSQQHGQPLPPRYCTFDNGIVLHALTRLYAHTGETRYRIAADRIAQWLVGAQRPDGSLPARFTPEGGWQDEGRWSDQAGSFHAKTALALLATGAPEAGAAARRLAAWTLGRQQPDGRFITDRTDGSTFLHPACYSCEGLWGIGSLLPMPEARTAAARGVRWLAGRVEPHGGIANRWPAASVGESSDILAQAIRLFLLHGYSEQADAVLQRLLRYQVLTRDRRSRGAFEYGTTDRGAPAPHINTWATCFAIQALALYMAGSQSLAPADLL